jgi:predicted patatin/cPLA2 family phospholipase
METMGLVLEGGALRGQYTAGVLDAFLEAQVEFPYIIGVSAGASIACSYVSRQYGRNKTIVDSYRNDRRYLSLTNLVTTGSLFGMDFIYDTIPNRLVPFDFATFDASPTRFVTVCTDCQTGKAVYFEKEKEDHLTVLRASASMPFLSPMVTYRGRQLLDGALADSLPWGRAVAEGFQQNVVVLTRPAGYRKKAPRPWAARLAYGRYPNLVEAINSRWRQYNDSLEAIETAEARGDALVIRPSADLKIGRTEKSVGRLDALYELGRTDGKTALRSFRRKGAP